MKKLLVSTLSLCLLVSMNAFGAATASSSSSPSTSSSSGPQIKIPGSGSGMLSNDNIVAVYRDADKSTMLCHGSGDQSFSIDGNLLLAYVSIDGQRINLCSAATTKPIKTLNSKFRIGRILFVNKNNLLYSKHGERNEFYSWVPTANSVLQTYLRPHHKYRQLLLTRSNEILEEPEEQAQQLMETFKACHYNSKPKGRGIISPDSKIIATWNNEDRKSIRLFDKSTVECIGTWKAQDNSSLDENYNWHLYRIEFNNHSTKIAVRLQRRIKTEGECCDNIEAIIIVWDLDLQKRTESLQKKCARIIREHKLDVSLLPKIIVEMHIYPNNEHKVKDSKEDQ